MTSSTPPTRALGPVDRRCSSPRSARSWRSTARASGTRGTGGRWRWLRPAWVPAGGIRRAPRHRLRASGADLRCAPRAHHAAGGGDGGRGRRRRFRPRRLAGFLRHEQWRRRAQSSLPQQGRRHVCRCGVRAGDRRRESRRHRRLDGRGVGRLRQRRLRRSLPLQIRPARALSQRRRARLRPRVGARGPAAMGQRQRRHLVGLRRRRQARSLPLRLLVRGHRSLAPEDDAHHAGELRVRGERRPQVRVPEPRRRHVRGDVRGARDPVAAMDAGRGRRGSVRHGISRISSSPTTTASPQLYTNEGGKRFVEVGERDRRRPHAEERHERVVRRHLQRRPSVDLQDQHLRAWRARAGQRSLGAEGARRRRRARVREPRLDDGRRPRRLELGRAVRRSEQRRHARHVSRQRLCLGRRAHQLLVRLRGDRRRPQPHHRRRRQLAADARAEPLGLSAQAGLDQRRRRPVHGSRAGRRRDRHLRRPRGCAGGSVEPRRARRHRRESARAAARLREHRQPGTALDRVRPRRYGEQPQRDRRPGRSPVERPAAGAGGQRRQRVQRAESAPPALRPGRGGRGGARRDSLAVRAYRRRSNGPGSTGCTA